MYIIYIFVQTDLTDQVLTNYQQCLNNLIGKTHEVNTSYNKHRYIFVRQPQYS